MEQDNNTELTDAQRVEKLKQIEAELNQDKAAILQAQTQEQTGNVPVTQTTQPQVSETVVSAPQPKKQTEDLRRFMDKDGQVSDEKIAKSNENLEREARKAEEELSRLKSLPPEKRREELLKRNKELHAEFTRKRQELAKETKAVEPVETKPMPRNREELKKMFLEHAEKDPFEAIDQYVEAKLRNDPLRSEWLSESERRRETDNLSTLERFVEDGHEWLVNDPEQVERAKTRAINDGIDLTTVRNPYSVLVRYSDSPQGKSNSQAQTGPKTPILSATGAVPPPPSDSTAALESKANALDEQMAIAIKNRDYQKAREIEAKLGELLGRR